MCSKFLAKIQLFFDMLFLQRVIFDFSNDCLTLFLRTILTFLFIEDVHVTSRLSSL